MRRIVICLSLLTALCGTALAGPVSFQVSGEIDNQSLAGSDFDEGDPFSVTITYDTDTPINSYPQPNPAGAPTRVWYSNAITSITIHSVDDHSHSVNYHSTYSNPDGFGYIMLQDDHAVSTLPPRDGFRLYLEGPDKAGRLSLGTTDPDPNGAVLDDIWADDWSPAYEPFKDMIIDLYTNDTSFITGLKLPGNFDGVDFDNKTWFSIKSRAGGGGTDIGAPLQVRNVPEPASLVAMLGMGSVLLRRRLSW